jgi:hypothetical protein
MGWVCAEHGIPEHAHPAPPSSDEPRGAVVFKVRYGRVKGQRRGRVHILHDTGRASRLAHCNVIADEIGPEWEVRAVCARCMWSWLSERGRPDGSVRHVRA